MGRHATPHIPDAYNDVARGYPPDTRQGQYNHIAPQQPPLRPSNTPPDLHRPKNMKELISDIIRATFGVEAKDRARENQKPYPYFYDAVPYPPNYKIPEFTKFSGVDSRTTYEHVDQFLAQCGRASSMDTSESNVGPDYLANLDNNATIIIAEPSDGSDCVTSLDNDGIAEPSNGLDCVASLESNIIENIAELSNGSNCIISESEIALSPKTESQIGHVDIGKDDDNVLRDSGEIESKVAMHTYQRPYPEHVDSIPYPQGFKVPNFTKFTDENAMTTMEHIGRFIDQCGKAGSDDLLKLKLFPLSLSNFASTWYSLLAPNSISTWLQMKHEFHDYVKDASLIEQRPIDTSSVTCETISVTSMPKTGIVSNPLPISPIDVNKKKGKSVIIGDPRPKTRINNAKAEDHKVAKDESSSFQRTKKPKLTFEMLIAKYEKGLAAWKQSPRTVPSHSNSRQDRFPRKNRSSGSKVKNVKKLWVRKEEKAPEVVAIKEKSQDIQVPIEDAAKTIQAEKTEADAVAVDIGSLTEPAGRSNRQTTAGLTDPPSRSDRRLVAGLIGPRGRSDRGALEKSGKIESNIGASTSTKNMKNHCLAPRKQPQPKWIPSGLSRSQKRRLQRLRAIGQKEKEAEDVENKICNNLEPRTTPKRVWRPKEVKSKRSVISQSRDKSNLMREESSVIRDKSPSHDAMDVGAVFVLPLKSCNQESRFCLGGKTLICS
uniref:Retrotransposon protein, putative, Ty3-gypsy subclass n=1 Tax=Oryza sativa subsp. japonica TaxID=39947 RepID=Q2QVQ1_ORYSJ|nr:retrotransposon protein, putative, Ty3-gypsy subclass [Oryza sativa Japonica Group]